jgi:hypothetical protein
LTWALVPWEHYRPQRPLAAQEISHPDLPEDQLEAHPVIRVGADSDSAAQEGLGACGVGRDQEAG